MIKHYQYGSTTFQTGAVVLQLDVMNEALPYFKINKSKDELCFSYTMDSDDIIYGLGENMHGINKRGFVYCSECRDVSPHTEALHSLYAAHNFFVVDGDTCFAIFIDAPGIVRYDVGHAHVEQLVVNCENTDLDVYLIEARTTKEIVRQFRQLIGQSYIPPKWGMGYGQSRFGYKNEEDISQTLAEHRAHDIPLDALYLDIDYMERYKDFTIHKERFPQFPAFVDKMKKEHIHLVPIIDAAIRIEKDYHVYEEGVQNNYFCKDINGNDFIAGVWPGKCHFPDFLNAEASTWFGDKYRFLLEQGIDGFWNDMNEPSIFYSQQGIQEAFDLVDRVRDQNLDIDSFFTLVHTFSHLSNNRKDYELFYHNVDGKKIRHDAIHNQYGYHMTKSAMEGFQRYDENKRFLLFSRSSSIGMHRYGGIWTGDNSSWWSHLLLNIKMMPSVQMCGFLFCGADVGGFMDNTSHDLLMRWMQFAIFTPLMRNHYCSSRDQEVYQFNNTLPFKQLIKCRYALFPYLYSEFMKAALSLGEYFYPIAFDYPKDSMARSCETQLFLGDSIMVAPIYEQNARGRYVYLPEDMMHLTMRSEDDFDYQILPSGHHYIEAGIHEFPLFIRKNKLLVIGNSASSTEELNDTQLKIIGYVDDIATYTYYHDDGYTTCYDKNEHFSIIKVKKLEDGYDIIHEDELQVNALCIVDK